MLPVLISLGPVRIYSMGLCIFLGILFGSFILFKKGREAHFEGERIFDVLFFSLFWTLIGARAGYIATHFSSFGLSLLKWLWITNYVGLWFWGGFVVGLSAFIYKVRQLGEEVFEWLDYLSLGLSLSIGFGLVGAFLNGSYLGMPQQMLGLPFPGGQEKLLPIQLIGAILFFLFFVWWMKLEKRYRMFEWYRAGKVTGKTGFLWFGFLIFTGALFGFLSLLMQNKMILFGINTDLVLSLVVMFVGIVGLYLRSGRKLNDEWRKLFSGRRRRRFSKISN